MMKKTYLLIALLLPMALGAQEQRYQTLRLAPIDEADTLRFGWIDLLSPHAGQGVALANTYNELIAKREQYRAAQMEVGMAGNDEIAIPCTWSGVFNFNNHRPYTLSVYDSPEDEDDRPWTSVTKDGRLGMIDTTGVVRIPVRFDYSNRPQMVFVKTAKGELAAARDPKTHKWGLIDRSGAWYKPPFSADELEWDSTAGVFYDASGNEIRL